MSSPSSRVQPARRTPRLHPHLQVFCAFAARLGHSQAAGGLALMLAAAIAIAWANSPWAQLYHDLWHLPVSLAFGPARFEQSLHFLINDALMALFFLVVGMEIRRELHSGALAQARHALLPVIAALGGVALPALIYLGLATSGLPGAQASLSGGWAIPTATDIAFALGVLALLGRNVPVALRVFLLTLAVIDDLAAVLIIALFYSGALQWSMLLWAAIGLGLVLLLRSLGVRRAWAYVPPALLLWWSIWQTGPHPTLAGVLLGLMTPVHVLDGKETAPPAERVAASLHPWVTFAIMPLFALANAGVSLQVTGAAQATSLAVSTAVAAALILGKPLGVLLACWLALRLRLCALPSGLGWGHMLLAGLLAGIGFTMAIFIATLAFDNPELLDAAKLGVLLASATAAVLGLAWGRWLLRGPRPSEEHHLANEKQL